MKRKLVCALLIGCCVLGLGACGSSEEEQAAKYYEDELGLDKDDAKELADAFYGDKEDTTEAVEGETIVATEEILSAERFSDKIQIGSTVYEFPLTVGELLESGELSMDSEVTENSLVSPEENKSFTLLGPGVDISLSAKNNTDATTELKNCIIDKQMIGGDTNNVIFSGGLRVGMPFDEFTELYGEPDYIDTEFANDRYCYYEDMYYYNAQSLSGRGYRSLTGYSYMVSIDMDNACVSAISYTMGHARKSKEFKEYILSGDAYNLLCYVPEDLSYSGRLLKADENVFVLSMSTDTYTTSFDYEITEESLTNSLGNEVLYCTVNDDGTAVAIVQDDECYKGYYYIDNYCAEFDMSLKSGMEDTSAPISESAKEDAYNILQEILNKGITVE